MASADQQAPAGGSGAGQAALHPASGLVASIEKIIGRKLTTDEVVHWQKIQDVYGVSDDDPLVMVLTLLGVHQHLFNDVPGKITEAVDKAIVVHRTTLEDQATIVAKGLIAKLGPMFAAANPQVGTVHGPATSMASAVRIGVMILGGVACSALGAIFSHMLFK